MIIGATAKVIAKSAHPHGGPDLVTVEATYWRAIHSELMTHRMFSRNASSSRAIPVEKSIRRVMESPVIPVSWGKNQKGMQAEEDLSPQQAEEALKLWLEARDAAVEKAKQMVELGLHKQIVNRILEPWSTITTIITATEWENFFALRINKDAEPNMRHLAMAIKQAIDGAKATSVELYGWHLPYVRHDEMTIHQPVKLVKFSVARCARVSYLNHDGSDPDIEKDIALHDKLRVQGHMSPFEHQATPISDPNKWSGNLRGWSQHRKNLPGERVFKPC